MRRWPRWLVTLVAAVFLCMALAEVTHAATASSQRAAALIIGIAGYPEFPDKPLRFAKRDALEFAAFIHRPEGGGFRADRVRLLLNEQATRDGIAAGIEWLRTLKPDLVYVFFSGHGLVASGGRGYFMPWDGSPAAPTVKGIRMRTLVEDVMHEVAPTQAVFFIDACQAAMAEVKGGGAVASALPREFAIGLPEGIDEEFYIAFFSASASEESHESPVLQHGVFTYFLLQGLGGKADVNQDGSIVAGELQDFVRGHVDRFVHETFHTSQSPATNSHFRSDFVLASANPGRSQVSLPTSPSDDPEARRSFEEGQRLYRRGEVAKSLAIAERLTREHPTFADGFYLLGVARGLTGDMDGAIRGLTEALALEPGHLDALLDRSMANLFVGRYGDALADADAAIKIASMNGRAHVARCAALRMQGRYDVAIRSCDEAVRLDPKNVDAFLNRARCLIPIDSEKSLADYSRVIQLAPQFIDGYVERADLRAGRRDFVGAADDYSKAIGIDPKSARAYAGRSLALRGMAKGEAALRDAETAIKLGGNQARSWEARCGARYLLGNDWGAIDDCTEAIRLDPNNAAAFFTRSNAFRHVGNQPAATADFQRYNHLSSTR